MNQKTRVVSAATLTVLVIASIVVTVTYIDPTPSVTNVQLLDESTPTPTQDDESTPTQDDESTPTQDDESTPTQDDESTPTQDDESTPTQDGIEYAGETKYQTPIVYSFNTLFTNSACEFYTTTHVFVPSYIDCIVDDRMIVHEVKNGYASLPLRSESIDLYAGIMDGDCIDYIDTIQCN